MCTAGRLGCDALLGYIGAQRARAAQWWVRQGLNL